MLVFLQLVTSSVLFFSADALEKYNFEKYNFEQSLVCDKVALCAPYLADLKQLVLRYQIRIAERDHLAHSESPASLYWTNSKMGVSVFKMLFL